MLTGADSHSRLPKKINFCQIDVFIVPAVTRVETPTYIRLQREKDDALRAKDPEWLLPTGNRPSCDSYDVRFAELLMLFPAMGPLGLMPGNTYRSQREFQYRPRFDTTRSVQ